MRLYLVRHAQSTYNRLHLLNDNPSKAVGLTSKGIKQARLLHSQLKNIHFDKVFISDLSRTRETAAIIAPDIPATVDRRLNEIRTGFEGWPYFVWFCWLVGQKDRSKSKRYGAESLHDVYQRVQDFHKELQQSQSHLHNVLIISHASPLQMLLSVIDSTPLRLALQRRIANAQIIIREV